MIFEEVEPT